MVKLKRAYEPANSDDGYRVLVDRLWPRGVTKDRACLDLWLKDVAPSTELRQWFSHDPARWVEFRQRYLAELHQLPGRPEAVAQLVQLAARGHLTLVYGAREQDYNHAVLLRDVLLAQQG